MDNILKSIIILIVLVAIGGAYLNYRTSTYVTAEFKTLRPFQTSAPIYYNGFKIGKIVKVFPNKNYTATVVTMKLYPKHLRFPINISANLKKEKNHRNKKYDYIDLIYPKSPSIYYLKNGDRISGKTTVELESFLSNQDPETLEEMRMEIANTIKNLNITVQAIGDLFITLNSMAGDVSPNVVKASKDFSSSSSNLVKISENVNTFSNNVNEFSDNVNTALNPERIDNTAENVQVVSKNIKLMTQELNNTMLQVTCSIEQINRILNNINEMTAGLNCTMKKPFGGMRMIFGSPIGTKKCGCK